MFTWGFPCGSDGKESTCIAEDLGSIPGLGRSLGEGNATHSSMQVQRQIITGLEEPQPKLHTENMELGF